MKYLGKQNKGAYSFIEDESKGIIKYIINRRHVLSKDLLHQFHQLKSGGDIKLMTDFANVGYNRFKEYIRVTRSGSYFIITENLARRLSELTGNCFEDLINEDVIIYYNISNLNYQKNRSLEIRKSKSLPPEARASLLPEGRKKHALREYDTLAWISKANKRLKAKETDSEKDAAVYLKHKSYSMSRQVSFRINKKIYFADIFIQTKGIIVEIDGGYHNESDQKAKDEIRDNDFQSIGITTIRIKNEDTKNRKFMNILKEKIKGFKPNVKINPNTFRKYIVR